MNTWKLLVVASVFVLACATEKAAEKTDTKKEASGPERVALSNMSQFDITACGARAVELPAITQETIIGALLIAQPVFQECLVDPKSRGAGAQTKVALKTTVTEAEVKTEVSGENLEASGKACIEAAAKKLPLKPLDKGAAPVVGQFGFAHVVPPSPAVKFGVNLASDIVGTIRLSQTSWCDCYADLGVNPPPTVKAQLHFVPPAKDAPKDKDGNPPAITREVKMETGADVLATKLASCLEGKLKAMTLPAVVSELSLPYPFLLINSAAATESPDALPAFQFLQLEAIRGQRNADIAIQLGGRGQAAAAYDAVVAKYKAKPAPVLIKDLKEKCANVLAADDRWIASIKGVIEVDQRTLGLVATLKLKDPQWNNVETEAQKRVAAMQSDLAIAEKQKGVDTGACPKDRK